MKEQLAALGDAEIFAMGRDLLEAVAVLDRYR